MKQGSANKILPAVVGVLTVITLCLLFTQYSTDKSAPEQQEKEKDTLGENIVSENIPEGLEKSPEPPSPSMEAYKKAKKEKFETAIFNSESLSNSDDTLAEAQNEAEKAMMWAETKQEKGKVEILMKKISDRISKLAPWAAVVDFTVDSSVKQDISGPAVAVKLEQALTPDYRLVTRSQLNKAFREMKFQSSDLCRSSQAKKLGNFIGADYLITGSVVQLGDRVTVAAQIIDTETGEIKQTAEISAEDLNELNELFPVIARILSMNDDSKRKYLNEKFKYPRFFLKGKTLMGLKNYSMAAEAFREALKASYTPDAEFQMILALRKEQELKLALEMRAEYNEALITSKKLIEKKELANAADSLTATLSKAGCQQDLHNNISREKIEDSIRKKINALRNYARLMPRIKSLLDKASFIPLGSPGEESAKYLAKADDMSEELMIPEIRNYLTETELGELRKVRSDIVKIKENRNIEQGAIQ